GGYILTIGYLVIEASEIKVGLPNGKVVPGMLVGYDHTTGFGLLKSVVPISVTSLKLGDSDKIQVDESLLILPSPQQGFSSLAQMVSRRPFAGWWEYYLENPIYTFPTNQAWAGAPLLNADGKILGIGSLFVADAVSQGMMSPGNLFVPINLLKPILAELIEFGRRKTNVKPYLGLSSDDSSGRVVITRVNQGSPAVQAGILAQDIITHVNQIPVTTLKDFYGALWDSGESGSIVSLGITRGDQEISLRVQTVDRMDYFVKPKSY
ncbi:MAG: S1C family serine protease, partial [Litorivicinaceae bacterium]